jgi:hypothetical protein
MMTLSSHLVQAFNHPLGLCGRHDPAKSVSSVEVFEQRLSILTFGAVLDTKYLSPERWSALIAIHDHWLLDPSQVAYQSSPQVLAGMREAHISGPQYIARVWWQICRGVQGRFKGSWRDLFKANNDNAHTLQSYLQNNQTTFPVLSGPVISARWLDLVHRLGGVALQGWETLTVTLSSHPKKTARLFGIMVDDVHPQLSSALNAWPDSCRKLSEEFCGLVGCPRKK